MYIAYTNSDINSVISLDDDSNEPETCVTIDGPDDVESYHYFQDLTQFDEFINSAIFMRNRLAKRIGAEER